MQNLNTLDQNPYNLRQNRSKRATMMKVLFTILIIVFPLVMAEIMFSLLYNYITPQHGQRAVDIFTGKIDPTKTQVIQRHPYMLYVNTPGWKANGFQQVNSMGYRGRKISPQPAPGVIRILTIGGSTTFGQGVNDPEKTWSSQLERLLKQEVKGVEVVNGGLDYATSAELFTHYIFRDRYLGARMVIIHTGGNDGGPLAFEQYTPEYTHWRKGWASTTLQPRQGELLLLKSSVIKVLYAWWLRDRGAMGMFLDTRSMRELTPEKALANVWKNQPVGFYRNIDLLVRNILQDDAQPVLFAYVTPPQKIYENPGISTVFKPFHEAIEEAHAKNRQVLREIAAKYSIPLIDLPEGAIPPENFVDQSHVNEIGHQIKAQYVADEIKPLLLSRTSW